MTDVNALRRRFSRLYARLGARGGGMVFLELVKAWSEPHRRAHGPDRLVEVLDAFAHARDLAEDDEAVELALWFHARVVTPGKGRDAAASADRAEAALTEAGLPAWFARRVGELVRHVDAPPASADARVLSDCVRAVLAGDRHAAWARALAEEGGALPTPPLFHTPRFGALEEAASRNLAALDRTPRAE